MLNMEELSAMAAEAGFTHSALLDVSTLELRDEVRAMCSANTCRAYGKNWSCPPACGELEDLRQRIVPVGNAAGAGAKLALTDADAWAEAEALARTTEFLELATLPEFQDEFVEQLNFEDEDED